MKIVDKIRKECIFTRPEKNLSFYRPSTFFPRHFTLDPLHSPLDSQKQLHSIILLKTYSVSFQQCHVMGPNKICIDL